MATKAITRDSFVFVYGSLLSGLGNHGRLDDAELIGEGQADGSFEVRDFRGFPGAYRCELAIGEPLVGELYRASPDVMRGLDALEGNGSFYERERAQVTLSCGSVVSNVWLYLLVDPEQYENHDLASCDWRKYSEDGVAGLCR